MFKFLKEKLKSTIAKISKKVDEEGKEETIEVEKPQEKKAKPEKKAPKKEQKALEPKEKPQKPKEEPKPEKKETAQEKKEEPKEEKKGFFGKLIGKFAGKEEPKEEKPKEEPKPEKKEPKQKPEKKEKPVKKEKTKEAKPEKKEHPKKTEEKPKEEPAEEPKHHVEEKIEPEGEKEESKEAKEEVEVKEEEEEPEEKKGFFGKLKEKVVTKKISEEQFEDLFWNLEVALLENNVATEVIDKIKEDLKSELVDKPIRRSRIEETIELTLKKSISDLFDVESFNLLDKIGKKKPFIICFVGINGSGKTTTIAKVANLLITNKKKVVLAAADTFRAAAIDQLQIHADKLGVKLIRHDYGSDPAAVAFDAIKHAEAKGIDVVLIDTAGRMHANSNLMEEMGKIVRVAKPDLKIFVGESITGNDCVEQAKKFDETIGIDAIILSKADVDEKGGAAVSVSYVTKKPIIYIGVGQEYKDLKEFDSEIILKNLGFDD